MTSPMPNYIEQLLSTSRPDSSHWRQLCKFLDDADAPDYDAVKQRLQRWPRELPRPRPRHWNGVLYNQRLSLCVDFDEEDTYPLYIRAAAACPQLRLKDGTPAVTLWRQPRGVVELANGTKMTLGEDGMADLGGTLVVEWGMKRIPLNATLEQGLELMRTVQTDWRLDGPPEIRYPTRIELYVEVEVKLDGKMPPTCIEYRGDSKRQLTKTEQDQVTRQRARTKRGGCYIFAERVDEAVATLVKYRDDVVARML